MSNVKIFRLNSGEEILTRFIENDTSWTFKDPAILIPMERGQIGLMPWMMYSKASSGITVPNSYIAFTVEPLDELKNQYDSSLNKGIITSTGSVSGPSGLKLTV
tara:strand:- start:310 stop:621 length:312 start_codon:yes stop_codon:yes gene_type:complete